MPRSSPRHSLGAVLPALLVLAALLAAGCSAPTAAPAALTLDERATGHTVRVRTGTAVLVQLHSTYWSVPTSSAPQVLTPTGRDATTPTGTCAPGVGCGLSSAGFTAARPGTAQVTAGRTSCGEAMRCLPGQGSYRVTVDVTG
ncbi:hypothetical protein [Kitasatospora sp. NBC_01266]|uniref:hypothetical protein n=1 Tax=Kitasatospora sp. NBC_01266 TaxID=2903572 RepID=UPI002E35E0D3|nr:hypothetical protein [Kitasatospora sp. NBC_01266]